MSSEGNKFSKIVRACGPYLILFFVITLFAVVMKPDSRGTFFSLYNFKTILTQTVIVAIGTLGMTLIIVSGGIDLSVGSVVALTSVVGATALVKGYSPLSACGLTLAMGGFIGLINGTAISGLRMMPFIVTLGMMGIARGAAKWLSGSQTVSIPPESAIGDLMDPNRPFLSAPIGVWAALALAALMSLVMYGTVFGRYIFAIGANEAAARLSG